MPEPWHDLPLHLVTPGFLGRFETLEQKMVTVPFPVPSLRGVLGYWLRALAGDYANAQWLMHTNAPDRGRDISVERVSTDSLSDSRNQRVIIQAKHWLSKSVGPAEVSAAVAQVALWEPPRVHVLVVATSGRFTADAVAWIEKHNDAGKQPMIDMWAESHLELLLAQRPRLVAEFKPRSPT